MIIASMTWFKYFHFWNEPSREKKNPYETNRFVCFCFTFFSLPAIYLAVLEISKPAFIGTNA